MDMLRRHWQNIVLGVVIVAAAGLGGWGYSQGSAISAQMEEPAKLESKLKSLQSTGANPAMIEAEKARNARARTEFESAIRTGRDLQVYDSFFETKNERGEIQRVKREPLVPNALPAPASNADAFAFRNAYIKERDRLIAKLHGGPPPSAEDIQLVSMELRSKSAATEKQPDEAWSLSEGAVVETPTMSRRPQSREELLRQDASFVAGMRRAKQIWMYVEPSALGVHTLAGFDEPPSAESIWQAQMSLWIQRDIVTALARVNEAAAAELGKADAADKLWVANLPVKNLRRLSIRDRLGKGGGQNMTQVTWADSFTNKNNNASMFMVPVQMEVVVEAAALPALLTELARVNFYTPIAVSFYAVPPDLGQKVYQYGAGSILRVVIDLEGYYFRDVFEAWIPESLKPVLANPDAREPSKG